MKTWQYALNVSNVQIPQRKNPEVGNKISSYPASRGHPL